MRARALPGLVLVLSLGACKCSGSHDTNEPEPRQGASETTEPADENAPDEQTVPIPEDFADEAEGEIDVDNYRSELDAIARELDDDAPPSSHGEGEAP